MTNREKEFALAVINLLRAMRGQPAFASFLCN
jgi:hypothetical protein